MLPERARRLLAGSAVVSLAIAGCGTGASPSPPADAALHEPLITTARRMPRADARARPAG